jgi:hypothetical protein
LTFGLCWSDCAGVTVRETGAGGGHADTFGP